MEPYGSAILAVPAEAEGGVMETVKLTVRLPKNDLDFAKQYAQAHRITVTELIDRYLRSLRGGTSAIHPEVERISGLMPATVDARADYRQHALEKQKHR
jgi:hypothetical protein